MWHVRGRRERHIGFMEKSKGNRLLKILRRRFEDNIKADVKKQNKNVWYGQTQLAGCRGHLTEVWSCDTFTD
jgi:hypothetical protein